jgi:hypothetical protein
MRILAALFTENLNLVGTSDTTLNSNRNIFTTNELVSVNDIIDSIQSPRAKAINY